MLNEALKQQEQVLAPQEGKGSPPQKHKNHPLSGCVKSLAQLPRWASHPAPVIQVLLSLHRRRARAGRYGPSPLARAGRHPPSPPFFCQRLSQRARTYGDCAAFFPLGRKNGESKRRETKEKNSSSASSALRAAARRGDAAAARPLSPGPAAGASTSASEGTAPGDAARLFGARADLAAAAAGRRDRSEKGPASPSPSSPGAPRPAGPRRQAEGRREAARRRAEQRPRRSALRPPARGCGAQGSWRQLCRVTRREDCRARGRGLGAACERARAAGSPGHQACSAPLPAGPRRGRPARLRRRRPFLARGSEGEALRCERGAPPQRPPQRRAKPRPAPLRGAPAPSLPSQPSCVDPLFRHLPQPPAEPPLPLTLLSLHPNRGCGAPDAERMGRRLQMPRRPETPVRQ
ncbi:putative cuticle collagen 91 isoform X2 [Homo sapiens]|uniref:putative cuticle collagen 91 isoform X2 n=1 Tax=Homo sapiens TaxID=9606 RepID=UPI0007DC4E8B|nr:putative cuticle collagen 91 isoform X2 [Homo sapiens]|eukprot:XP_016860934.1 putative cuticle collagen 91 [Homo sapiens]